MKVHFKRGDEVVVLNGSQAGKRGKVLEVQIAKSRAIVEGVNLLKKATKKSEKNPQGGFVEREASLHISKLMLATKYDARKSKRGQAA
jgi:large subunit ribosomal protein L24